MVIERTPSEIILRLPANTDTLSLQKLINFLKFKAIIADSEASQEEIDKLANESKASWWQENKHRFTK